MKSTKPPNLVRPPPPPSPPPKRIISEDVKMGKDNLTNIKCKPHKFALLLSEARKEMQYQIEMQQLLAEITRGKYDALVKQGFTASQALELCKE